MRCAFAAVKSTSSDGFISLPIFGSNFSTVFLIFLRSPLITGHNYSSMNYEALKTTSQNLSVGLSKWSNLLAALKTLSMNQITIWYNKIYEFRLMESVGVEFVCFIICGLLAFSALYPNIQIFWIIHRSTGNGYGFSVPDKRLQTLLYSRPFVSKHSIHSNSILQVQVWRICIWSLLRKHKSCPQS